ncbi:MAG: hypothetical protein ACTHZ9_12385 [Leucobacter sp.]
MSEIETNEPGGFDRRTAIKGAAWAVPVIAAAVAAPMASASTGNASLAWTGNESGLLQLQLLDGSATVGALVAITVPSEFTLTNGAGAINQSATVTVVVGRPSGLSIPVGRGRGFGVATLGGVDVAAQNSTQYQSTLGVQYGLPITTFVGTHHFAVDGGQPLVVPVEFGLSGVSDLLTLSALANFPVNLTVDFGDGNTYSASSGISVPVGAGIL